MNKKRIQLVLGLIAALVAVNLRAAEPVSEEVPSTDLKEQNDATILTSRVWMETEWNKFTDGTHAVEQTLGAFWAWRLSDNADWAVRLKIPGKFRVGSDVEGVSDIGGFGDVKVATGGAYRVSKTLRFGGGVDLEMPTGRSQLSDNAWRIQEFVAMGWDITPWLTFSPSSEYNQSISEETNGAPIHFLETFVPLTFILPHKWAVSVGYENKADFENNNYVTNRAKIGIGKELESVPLSFYLQAKRDFDSGEKEFQVNFVVTYFFRPGRKTCSCS